MIISELINELEEYKKTHGDLLVVSRSDGFGGYAMSLSGGIYCKGSPDTINGWDFEDIDDELGIKSVFPDWDGTEDSLDELSEDVVVLCAGSNIYTT
jgi:hypothetical protein